MPPSTAQPSIFRSCLRPNAKGPIRRHVSGGAFEPVELSFERLEPPKTDKVDDGQAIVFLHGLFGSKQNNRSMGKALARDLGRRVYNLDLRNHGTSPHSTIHTYEAMAADVRHFLHSHKLKRTTLIGHSMGAKVAMTLCLNEASSTTSGASSKDPLVSSLISVDNAPLDAALSSDFEKYITGMRMVASHNPPVQSQAEADAILSPYAPELPVRQFLLTNLVRSNGRESHAAQRQEQQHRVGEKFAFRIPLRTLSTAIGLGQLADFPYKSPGEVRWEGRALFVRGVKSRYVPDEALPVIGAFFPKFELLDVDSGHWVISEKPEEFRRGVVDFLKNERGDD